MAIALSAAAACFAAVMLAVPAGLLSACDGGGPAREAARAVQASQGPQGPAPDAAANSRAVGVAAARASQDDAAARLEVAELRRQVAELREQVARMADAGPGRPATRPARTGTQAREDWQQARQARAASLEAAWQGERVDPGWSRATVAAVQAAFAQSGSGATEALHRVECRSQTCRIEVRADADPTLQMEMPNIMTRLAGALSHVAGGRTDGDGEGDGVAVFYLAR
jgi:hypothetical protein